MRDEGNLHENDKEWREYHQRQHGGALDGLHLTAVEPLVEVVMVLLSPATRPPRGMCPLSSRFERPF